MNRTTKLILLGVLIATIGIGYKVADAKYCTFTGVYPTQLDAQLALEGGNYDSYETKPATNSLTGPYLGYACVYKNI